MKVKHILDLSNQPVKHPELKLLNQYTNHNFGKSAELETKDVIVRDGKTGNIFGRRTVVQRKI